MNSYGTLQIFEYMQTKIEYANLPTSTFLHGKELHHLIVLQIWCKISYVIGYGCASILIVNCGIESPTLRRPKHVLLLCKMPSFMATQLPTLALQTNCSEICCGRNTQVARKMHDIISVEQILCNTIQNMILSVTNSNCLAQYCNEGIYSMLGPQLAIYRVLEFWIKLGLSFDKVGTQIQSGPIQQYHDTCLSFEC